MIIVSSLQFAAEEEQRVRFSTQYSNYASIFSNYSLNENLQYRFNVTDFYIRGSFPSNLDIVINIWIIGKILIFFSICNFNFFF